MIEDESIMMKTAEMLKEVSEKLNIPVIYKSSFTKDNRSALEFYHGPGLDEGLKILQKVKEQFGFPLLSDIHDYTQAKPAAEVLDVIQIPAFLCRQTDLILQAARTKKVINIKKGQFISPKDIKYIIEKVESTGNKKILVTERGSCFGYNNLVVDFRSFLIMKKYGYPVIYDLTHSLQNPSAKAGVSGGDREFAPALAKAAIACGVDGLFMEVHPNPKQALSDAYTSLPLTKLKNLIMQILKVRKAVETEDKGRTNKNEEI